MDHLIPTKAPELRLSPFGLTFEAPSLREDRYNILVPYVARNEYMWRWALDRDGTCLSHGKDTGWENRLKTGDFGGFTVDDAVSFLQSWLFFGMMEDVLQTPIDVNKFITITGGQRCV